jgi:hypothetical protein
MLRRGTVEANVDNDELVDDGAVWVYEEDLRIIDTGDEPPPDVVRANDDVGRNGDARVIDEVTLELVVPPNPTVRPPLLLRLELGVRGVVLGELRIDGVRRASAGDLLAPILVRLAPLVAVRARDNDGDDMEDLGPRSGKSESEAVTAMDDDTVDVGWDD